jgi:hypothetical protein
MIKVKDLTLPVETSNDPGLLVDLQFIAFSFVIRLCVHQQYINCYALANGQELWSALIAYAKE